MTPELFLQQYRAFFGVEADTQESDPIVYNNVKIPAEELRTWNEDLYEDLLFRRDTPHHPCFVSYKGRALWRLNDHCGDTNYVCPDKRLPVKIRDIDGLEERAPLPGEMQKLREDLSLIDLNGNLFFAGDATAVHPEHHLQRQVELSTEAYAVSILYKGSYVLVPPAWITIK